MKNLLLFCGVGMLLCCGGCARAIAAFATPTQWEIKIPAEYSLSDNKPQRLLVLVEQQGWTTSEANMRVYLTQAVEVLLEDKVGIKPKTFVPYQELADMRSNSQDFTMLSPVEVGKRMQAQMVLYIMIDNFGLYGLSDAGYYRGQLDSRSGLYDVASGQQLWPQSNELKTSSVSFDQEKGQDQAARRLAKSAAKCIVRNFYDCPKPEYRVADESVKEDFKGW